MLPLIEAVEATATEWLL